MGSCCAPWRGYSPHPEEPRTERRADQLLLAGGTPVPHRRDPVRVDALLMEALAIPAVVGAALLLCLFAGWALVRRWKPPASRAPSERAPEQWRALLEARVPLVRRLSPAEWDRLFELVQTFLREKHFEGGGGLEVTDEMKIIVAAQACLLILHLDAGCYPGVRTIILYPSTFLRRSPVIDGRMYVGVIPHPEPLLGEHVSGAVVLAWDSSLHGASDTGRWAERRAARVRPRAGPRGRIRGRRHRCSRLPLRRATWARVLQQRFDELRRSTEDGRARRAECVRRDESRRVLRGGDRDVLRQTRRSCGGAIPISTRS